MADEEPSLGNHDKSTIALSQFMGADNSNKTRGLLANPLPIVMMVLLAAGVLVKNVPLESA